jgi:hypothetical protein
MREEGRKEIKRDSKGREGGKEVGRKRRGD